jgi:hypothetical protein
MARLVIALLVTLSLAFGGAANAMAAADCPYLKAATSHDCCPPTGDPRDESPEHSKALDCKLGQACRAATAVTPLVPVFARMMVVCVDAPSFIGDEGDRPSPLFSLWKPPRSA